MLTYNDALMLLGVGFAIGLVLMPLARPRAAPSPPTAIERRDRVRSRSQ